MSNKIIIGMAARMTSDKYQNLLIDTVNINKVYFRKKNVTFHLAGDGDMLCELKRKVKKDRIHDLIKFQGYLNEEKLISWLRKIKIYIHLSKDETTSTSILQAMSMSLPVIASNIGGNRNFLKYYNRVPNIVLAKNNVDDIFVKIKELIISKNRIEQMSKLSRKTILKFYSSINMFNEYEKLF